MAIDISPVGLARMLLKIIAKDQKTFTLIDDYIQGRHERPYMPPGADDEYRMLAERSVSNWIPLLVDAPAQTLYVDSFRRGNSSRTTTDSAVFSTELPEWKHWQESRLDARQLAIHRGALKYGHSFTLTLNENGKVITRGLSALNTAAVYVDPANDVDPFAALTVTEYPKPTQENESRKLGRARLFTRTTEYSVTFEAMQDEKTVRVRTVGPHGLDECPVTRFAASIDLEGRTTGVVLPNIPVQNRINQTVLDLLVAQTYGSFKVRWVTGLAPPIQRWSQSQIDSEIAPEGTVAGDPVIDPDTGDPVAKPINLNARRFFFAEDEKTKFGTLDETPLEGYIKSLDMSIRHLAAITQTPPHYLLGEIANLSAEALQAAETALLRKSEEFRKSFGESWERVFRLAAKLSGEEASAVDYSGEVIWRDVEMRPLSVYADGLVKLKELGIPMRGLWPWVPKTTRQIIEEWERMRDEDLKQRKAITEAEEPPQLANTFGGNR